MAKAYMKRMRTEAVRSLQERMGSAKAYDKFMAPEFRRDDRIGPQEAQFIALRDGFYMATVNSDGWPYVQFRGGPRGFLKVLDETTLAFADFRGNRQYISTGNLATDDRVSLILVDYPNQARIKILGRARIVEDDDLIRKLHDASYKARPERAIVISLEAFDWNCKQHIPQRLTIEELQPILSPFQAELAELKAENERLRNALNERS